MRTLLPLLLLVGCGDDGGSNPPIDSVAGGDSMVTDMGSTADAPPALTLTCASYCTGILARCSAANAQFANMTNCMDSCANFRPGLLGETAGNTLGCRVYHTEAAASAPNTHCVHAGPAGGGMCGATLCEGFCSIASAECPTQWPTATCATLCPGVASSGSPFNTAAAGDTIECRLYHATMAATAPGTHCSHTTRIGGGGVCN